jgi:hypothetical protein
MIHLVVGMVSTCAFIHHRQFAAVILMLMAV